jgi:hypothetical protein
VETTAGNNFKKEGKAAKIGKMIWATVVCFINTYKGLERVLCKQNCDNWAVLYIMLRK